ncbi:MAG: purine-binding chemotaxis protein CheW [Nitrospinae bacterium]|nr:purine-binding chemotaxis protein CheW [Nitrospinota bacterium]
MGEAEKTEVVKEKKTNNLTDLAGKYLTFKLAQEEYGLEILTVREIMGMMEITMVPQTPDYLKGVINLRGKVIPVIDLRSKFGMEESEYTKETCIIVVDVQNILMGIIVDTVSEVIDVNGAEIEPPPKFSTSIRTDFIMGIGKTKGNIVILLDIDKVLSVEEFEALDSLAETE